jgi:hypothetical protein
MVEVLKLLILVVQVAQQVVAIYPINQVALVVLPEVLFNLVVEVRVG